MRQPTSTDHQPRVSIRKAARFAATLLARELPSWALYHSVEHTRQTVAACREIGRVLRLNDAQMAVVVLAAWFHDTGYGSGPQGHEARSARIAERYLTSHGYPKRMVTSVKKCILATHVPQRPRSLLQRVLCDADLISLGKRTFLVQNELLRQEMELRERRIIEERVWLHRSYRFLHGHRFATSYGRTVLESGKQANLGRLRKMIRMRETSLSRWGEVGSAAR